MTSVWAIDIHNFLDGLESTSSEDVTGLGDLPVPRKASVLHHEAVHRIREELTQHEAEVREFTEKRDTYKLLSEKLQNELEAARKDHTEWAEQVNRVLEDSDDELDSVANDPILQELQSELNSTVAGQESLATELEAAKSEVAVASTKANAKVDQFKVDVEAIQAQAKSMVDHANWEALKEALEGVHAQGFDILAKIENAKVEEARARKLVFSEEDSKSLTKSEGREDPEDEDATPDEDQAS
ncbi:uncharacterized protein [Nicotiana tomentosiformis]|uniref:uncharacterized protein n=1 Tax=Nicotiana tomentosiformis TaxID=4098 RepID=UPI00388C8F23